MSFYNCFKAISVVMVALVSYVSAAKVGTGKVSYKIGDATFQKGGQGDWKDVRQSQTVKQADKIRTLVESQVVITLPDGSSISIEENSIVELSELLSEDGKNKFAADIKSGRLKFDIQKQGNAQSSIKFKTGTATAAIRGTTGFTGLCAGNKPCLSLSAGLVEYNDGTNTYSVGAGQTAISDGKTTRILDMSASGNDDFFKELDNFLKEINADSMSLDDLVKLYSEKDAEYKKFLDEISESLKCTTTQLPDTTDKTNVEFKVLCPNGVITEFNNTKVKSEGKEITYNSSWAASTAAGPKEFKIKCYVGRISGDCGLAKTYYLPKDTVEADSASEAEHVHVPLTMTTTSVDVCEAAKATFEGAFDPTDPSATLFITIGKTTSGNLVTGNTSGHFIHNMTVNDDKGNWNETVATVTYTSNKYGVEEVKVPLNVDKSCQAVNTKSPSIKLLSVDSVECKAQLQIGNVDENVIFTSYIDGTYSSDEVFSNNGIATVSLKKPVHEYTFAVEDIAKNRQQVTKTLGCYPKGINYGITMKGKSIERLRVPPPPRGITSSAYRNLHFSITGLDQNNTVYIKEILIYQDGREAAKLIGSDLQYNSFDYQVELPRSKGSTKIRIDVKMKNGEKFSATKTYEVNK